MGFFRRMIASIGYLGRIHESAHRRVFVGLLLGFAVTGCTSVTPRFGNGGFFCPSGTLTNGSREFNGAVDFDITVDLSPTNMGRSINAHVKMVAAGPGGNITREWDEIVYTRPPDSEGIITAIDSSTGRAQGRTPAADFEIPPCNDGTLYSSPDTLTVSGVISRIEVIGDTGAEDISHDSDCRCDTQIRSLTLGSVELTIEGRIVSRDRADTTPPRISFWIHPTSPALDSPSTAPISMSGAVDVPVGRCVYVNSPFRVAASASDEGGIRSIKIGPIFGTGGISVRGRPIARFRPNPVEGRGDDGDDSYPNPGNERGSPTIDVDYRNGPVHNAGSLSGVYEFERGADGIGLRAEAYNFREDEGGDTRRGLSQIWDYWVKPVPRGISPGTECRPGID